MSRQHATPLLIGEGCAIRLVSLSLGAGPDQVSEAALQSLLHDHPTCLPIAEIDPLFADPVPICMELATPVGPIDNFLLTPSGLPILVECKLWRNPEGRREVVGQILDYAKELTRWSSSDLQREVARRVPSAGNPLIDMLHKAGHDVDEAAFNDALTHNLRRGRFLLLIVGDGIREGVEAISEYLQVHAGLHFSLGLVELPIYRMPDGGRMVVPRVLARTQLITRTVITVPDGQQVLDDEATAAATDEEHDPLSRISFWTDYARDFHFDDPQQPLPRPSRQGWLNVMMPVPSGNSWITVYRNEAKCKVGLYLSYTRETIGADISRRLLEDWNTIQAELGGTAFIDVGTDGRRWINDALITGPWTQPTERTRAIAWLRSRTNDFVNVLRPRVRAAMADLSGGS